MIYLDNAATTLIKPKCVIESVMNAFSYMGNSGRGVHNSTLKASETIYSCREKIAKFFNVSDVSRVIFTSNITESLNIVINGLIDSGDHVITTCMEHNSVLRPLYRLEKEKNVEISFIKIDKNGNLLYDEIEKSIKDNTRCIITTFASNVTGNVVDVKKISDIAHKHNLIYIVDAAQAAGSIPIDIESLSIDILCFTGHKGLFGPQGTGGICFKNNIQIRPFKVGGSGVKTFSKEQPNNFPTLLEAGTLNGHGIVGLSSAIDFINEIGIVNIHKKEVELMKRFYYGINNIDGIKIYGEFSKDYIDEKVAIVTFNIKNVDSGEVSMVLQDKYDIATRSGAHCAPLLHESFGTKEQGAVRFSFSYFNTIEEVDVAIEAIKSINSSYE